MLGGFIRGIVGAAITACSGILFLVLLAAHIPIAGSLGIAGGLWLVGCYLTYVSRRTVRVRR